MASRTWLAVILCFAIWLVYLQWFAPLPTHSNAPVVAAGTSEPGAKPAAATAEVSAGAPVSNPLFATPIPAGTPVKVAGKKLEVSFSTLGGKPVDAKLLDYHVTIKKDSPYIAPISHEASSFSLATLFTDPSLASFGDAEYQASQPNGDISFTRESNGVRIVKTYHVNPDTYIVNATYQISFPAGQKNNWGYLIVPVGAQNLEHDTNDPVKSWEVVMLQNDSLVRKSIDSLPNNPEVNQGTTSFYAFGNRYFSTALVNNSRLNPDVVFVNSQEFKGGYLRYPLVLREGETSLEFKVDQYIGPKDYDYVSKVPKLTQLIDYGRLEVIAIPLVRLLKFFHSLIPNYGVAIILLTILVRLVFFPLQAKSVRSMKAMQKLQPQIAALKEKHKDDMARFNQEQMALFKAHKVNPMGGCLPILVQLPVLFALYSVIQNSIELFHAPFFGWIHDLSAKDPFYIYPVLMGVSMFAQQKLTPSAGMDPMQQKMMMFMPIIFAFMMIGLPSGLTLYIFISTVLGIAQQVLTRDKTVSTVKLATAK